MLLASNYTKLLELFSFISLKFKWDTTVDHLALGFEGLVHSVKDVVMWLTANEG